MAERAVAHLSRSFYEEGIISKAALDVHNDSAIRQLCEVGSSPSSGDARRARALDVLVRRRASARS